MFLSKFLISSPLGAGWKDDRGARILGQIYFALATLPPVSLVSLLPISLPLFLSFYSLVAVNNPSSLFWHLFLKNLKWNVTMVTSASSHIDCLWKSNKRVDVPLTAFQFFLSDQWKGSTRNLSPLRPTRLAEMGCPSERSCWNDAFLLLSNFYCCQNVLAFSFHKGGNTHSLWNSQWVKPGELLLPPSS